MKTIFIYSHQIKDKDLKEKTLPNGDKYDSQIEVWETGKMLWKGVCNVDSSNRLKHKIEIKNGNYWGIAGLHKGKYKGIMIINQYPTNQNWTKLTEEERTLNTIQINPKWKNKIAKFINIHKGGDEGDWSEGCITIHRNDYDNFIKFFEINEIVNIEKA